MARILVDMDEVVADSLSRWISILKKRYPKNVPENYSAYSVGKYSMPWDSWGLTRQEWRGPILEPGFYRNLNPLPGAITFIQKLLDNGHEIIFVTIPPKGNPTAAHEKEIWIEEHLRLRGENVVFTRRKELIRGDVLIDDKPSNLEKFQGRRILYDYRHAFLKDAEELINWDKTFDCYTDCYQGILSDIKGFTGKLEENFEYKD